MKKAKSSRPQRSKIDTSQYLEKEKLFEQEKTILQEMVLKQEKQLIEMTATVNDLAITIQRDNFKKELDRWESAIERIRRTLLEWVSELRQVAEKWKVTGHILIEIDDLQTRNEERIGQLLTISNAIKKIF